jgi:hypothetical protein
MIFGAVFLLAFGGGLAGLYSLRPEWVTAAGIQERLTRLRWGTTVMAIASWLTVLSGTYIVYPWYRAAPPEGADLSLYPRSFLKADPGLSAWHTFGMEWKEHVAWFSPLLAVVVAYIAWKYGPELVANEKFRRITMIIFILSFTFAGIAGLLGALITKAAPLL